jgi:hypothetical protein
MVLARIVFTSDFKFNRCEPLKQLIRSFETKCEANTTIGGQKDEHGCLTGAGFSWNVNL